jgi:RNA polymerase sigma-70 factor (ECF subfamily)
MTRKTASVARSRSARQREEFDAFRKDEAGRLARFVARRIANPAEAAEVRQMIWLEFLAWWDEHPARVEPTAMLFKIAWCRVVDHYRVQVRYRDLIERLESRTQVSQSTARDPIAEVIERVDLMRALRSLTPRQLEAIFLRYFDDLPIKQVAELMGITSRRVDQLLADALEVLRTDQVLLDTGDDSRRARKEVSN